MSTSSSSIEPHSSSPSSWIVRTQPRADRGEVLFTSISSRDGSVACEVCHFGATVTSWSCDSVEHLYLSEKAIFDNKKAIRGGIPLVFPQFGQKNKAMASHGFARNKTWTLSDRVTDCAEYIEVIFTLRDDPSTFEVFPFHFDLEYRIRLFNSRKLECALTCSNIDPEATMRLTMLLHTYLRVTSISETIVEGFQSKVFTESLGNPPYVKEEDRAGIRFAEEVDRVYHEMQEDDSVAVSAPNQRKVLSRSHASLTKLDDSLSTSPSDPLPSPSTSNNMESVDVVLWNPWITKTISLTDMPASGYEQFVCVEPGVVRDWLDLPPSTAITLTQVLALV